MATLLLSAAGAALGGLLGPVGAMAGRLAGAMAGSILDQRLFGRGGGRAIEGPRLTDLDVHGGSEGAALPAVFGRARIGGTVIWATRFEEVATTTTERAGKGAPRNSGTTTTRYAYYANVAVALCEGPIAHVGRIFADGKVLDLDGLTLRIHRGTEDQAPDPLIQAKEGTPEIPAYRGTAYVVFERLPLARFGNRLPQFAFEVVRPIGRLEGKIRGVCLIPGATEAGYHTLALTTAGAFGASRAENRHTGSPKSDILVSLDELQRLCPNLDRVAIVAGWFGTDLRCGRCEVKPGVTDATRSTPATEWSVAGLNRGEAYVVSTVDGRPAYGGTPSDASILALIAELKARGLKVTLLPFLFMDVPAGNTLPNPWTGAPGQPALPWRGRITCDPAPGRPGTPDASASVIAQLDAFFGTAARTDFALAGETVAYSGPEEWRYRRMILHMAMLAKAAGGVDTFLIGSEMPGLTRLRAARRAFPAAERLAALAADVEAIGGVASTVSYAADWTEYGGHVPPSHPNDLVFPLDRLWASSAIDLVGIDWYAPLTDWREGGGHADAALARGPADRAYLESRVAGGEAFDWYYADDAGRAAQARLPITDGAYGKPWAFRPKDLAGWWGNAHVERIDGVEVGPTAWQPGLKPIRFVELGVPAVDKGTNQPNVFPDANSSEGGLPFASDGSRDDALQRRALEVLLDHFDPATPAGAAANPVSPHDGRRMLDHAGTHLWAWDARPWPAFPGLPGVWGDAPNWRTGHWLNGRLGAAPLGELVEALAARFGPLPADARALDAVATGYVLDRPMSGRAALETPALAFGIDLVMRRGVLTALPRGARPVATLTEAECAVERAEAPVTLARAEESALPQRVAFTVSDPDTGFRRRVVEARRGTGAARRESRSDLALVLPPEEAEARADLLLRRLWTGRDAARFALPPSRLALEPGDVVGLESRGRTRFYRITRIEDAGLRRIEAEAEDGTLALPPRRPMRPPAAALPRAPGRPRVIVMDLPALPGDDAPWRPRLAVLADPWPGTVALWCMSSAGPALAGSIDRPALAGELIDTLPPGPVWRFDRPASVRVRLPRGEIGAVTERALLDGANVFALDHGAGRFEMVQAAGAVLEAPGIVRLSKLLRGQLGTEALARSAVAPGALLVAVDDALLPLPVEPDDVGRPQSWTLAPGMRGLADAAAVTIEVTPAGRGLVPLAPVHLSGRRGPEGVDIRFVRRTRVGGDGWGPAEVPLGEEREGYRVEILSGSLVARTYETQAQRLLYPSADEIADFGAPQPTLSVRVAQIGALLGPGEPASALIRP